MPRGLERPLPPATAGYERLRRMIDDRKPGAISIRVRKPVPTEGPSAGLLLALVAARAGPAHDLQLARGGRAHALRGSGNAFRTRGTLPLRGCCEAVT